MTTKRHLPLDFQTIISKYNKNEHEKIEREYNNLYDLRISKIVEDVETKYQNDYDNFETHNFLLSNSVYPFIKKFVELQDFELLFVDPLFYQKNKYKEVPDIPTFDFVIGQKNNNKIICLIFGEVKGQSPHTAFNSDILKRYENDPKIKDKIFKNINNLNANLEIPEDVIFEYVIVSQGIHIPEFLASIKNKKIPFILWEIHKDVVKNKYRFIINENICDPKIHNQSHSSKSLLKFLTSKFFELNQILEFTHSMDISLIILKIKEDYIPKYGTLISDENLREIIFELGMGYYYDDSRIVEDFIIRIKNKGLEFDVIGKKLTSLYFKQVDFKEKIIEYRIKKRIEKKIGDQILILAIENVNPIKQGLGGHFRKMDEWLDD